MLALGDTGPTGMVDDDAIDAADGRRGTLRAFAGVLTTLVTVAALGGSAYWLYLKHRESSLTTRSYRAMTLLGRQFNTNLDGYRATLLARVGGGSDVGCAAVKNFGFGFSCDDTAALPPVLKKHPERVPATGIATYFTHKAGYSRVHLCTRAAPVGEASQLLCISKSLDAELPALRWDLFGFDALTVVTGDGKVVAQAGSLIQRISVLTEGMEAARRTQTEQQWFRPTEPKDAPKDAPRPETSIVYMASKPDATLVGGQRYLLFSWGPLPGDDPTGGESTVGEALWLVGFAQEIPYLANVHRIPYAGLITSLVILLLLLFSWQLLKIRWLAPQERLHGADVRILGLSVLGLVGAMTILLLAARTHTTRELQQDEELKKLADTVAGRLRGEVVDASDQLSELRTNVSCAGDGCGCKTPQEVTARHVKNVLLLDSDGYPRCWLAPQTGAPRTLGVPSMVTKASFADRQYFNDAQAGQMWRINDPRGGAARELAVEVLRTRTSNEYQLAVAAPYAPALSKKSPVLVVSTDPHPFDAPILPEGFGFAVVNRIGEVLLHFQNSRNLSENLVDETENNLTLRTALASGRSMALDLSYAGNEYTARVASIQEPGEWIPWAVVVFRTKSVLRTLDSETLLGAGMLLAAYLIVVVLILVASQLRDRRNHAKWLWPERGRSSVIMSLLVAIALLATGLLTFCQVDGRLPVLQLVVPAVMMLAISASCLVLGGMGEERRLAFVGGGAGIAILVVECWRTAPWLLVGLACLWGCVFLARAILRSRSDGRVASERNFRVAYVALLAAMAFLLGGLPAALMVGAAGRHTDAAFASLLHQQYESRRRERDAGIVRRVAEGEATGDETKVLHERCADTGDVYDVADRALSKADSSVADTFLEKFLPPLGELSERLHALPKASREQGSPERASECCDPAEPDECITPSSDGATTKDGAPQKLAHEPLPAGIPFGWLVAASVALLLFIFADVARRIFLLDVDADGEVSASAAANAASGCRLRRRSRAAVSSEAGAPPLDAGRGAGAIAAWRAAHEPLARQTAVEIINVDVALGDDDARTALRGLLEALVYETDADVVLTATENPIGLLLRSPKKAPVARKADDAKSSTPEPRPAAADDQVTPWLLLLGRFESCPAETRQPASDDLERETRHWLRWRRRSRAERLALAQLANESFLNPNNGDVVRGLVAAGVLRRERGFEFADPTFEIFVRRAVPQATIRRWEREGVAGGWEDVRTHLAAVLAVAGTFIFLTQPDLFNTAALTLAGVAAGVPTLTKLVSMFGGEKRESR